jgi:hypothetical protein
MFFGGCENCKKLILEENFKKDLHLSFAGNLPYACLDTKIFLKNLEEIQ